MKFVSNTAPAPFAAPVSGGLLVLVTRFRGVVLRSLRRSDAPGFRVRADISPVRARAIRAEAAELADRTVAYAGCNPSVLIGRRSLDS